MSEKAFSDFVSPSSKLLKWGWFYKTSTFVAGVRSGVVDYVPSNFPVGSLTIANMLHQMKNKLGNSTCWDPRNEAYKRGEPNSEDDKEGITQHGSCVE